MPVILAACRLSSLQLDVTPLPAAVTQQAQQRGKRANDYLRSRQWLALLLQQHYGKTLNLLQYHPSGMPHLAGGGHLSLSHSDDLYIWALNADAAIGVDVEIARVPTSYQALARRYFSDAEQQYINNADNHEQAFRQLWCSKEALIKASNTTIAASLRTTQLWPHYSHPQLTLISHHQPQFSFALAAAQRSVSLRCYWYQRSQSQALNYADWLQQLEVAINNPIS